AILVDNSPTALVLPAPFLVHVQSLEEYRQSSLVGTYLTMLRLVAVPMAMLLAPVWLLLSLQPELLPESLKFIGPRTLGKINIGLQFILASLGIDLIRMASIHTPNTLATSLGLIGALMLGEFSVKAGLFNSEVIFYMAISAIATFTIPGYELALVMKLSRFLLLLLVIFFQFWGLLFGIGLIFIFFLLTKTFGIPYLWPIIPLDLAALKTLISRQSVLSLPRKRPGILKTQDPDRRPPDNGSD
ncbi:MAG: spore germination protein, partial [Desulfovibrionales bacterium]|nr:spore germination protein [Desulfovibrionales bacterium]